MQRGLSGALLSVLVVLGAGVAGAQPTGDVYADQFVGPRPSAEGGDAAVPVPEVEAPAEAAGGAAGAPTTAGIESKPLGPSEGTFRDRLAAGRAEGELRGAAPVLRAGEGWWRTAGALAVIIALIFAAAALVRRWAGRSGGLLHAVGAGGRSPSGLLYVLGRYPVGRGQTLVLLKLDRRVLLVCQSAGARGGGMRTLCELTDPGEVASIVMHAAEAEGRSLHARFREVVSGFEASHADAEVVLPAVELPERGAGGGISAGGVDPVGRLHSRLDSLRQAGWGAQS